MNLRARALLLPLGLAGALVGVYGCGGSPTATSTPRTFEEALVLRVIDGDTVELDNGERVRYLGIDTPETVHPEKPVECYGPEASDRNKELVEGKVISLLGDGPDRDDYGRLLRYVFVDGTFVNADMVWGGYAYARSYGDPPSLYQTLEQLERSAREEKRGLWQACLSTPTMTATPEPMSKATPIPPLIRTPPLTLTATPISKSCCKICVKGKACGDTCISRSYTCHVGPGCACNR